MDRVDNLLGRRFKQLVDKAHLLQRWQKQLEAVLEPSMRGHIQVVNYHEGRLQLMADNANWATRIRFAAPQMLTALQQSDIGDTLKVLKCVVRPIDTAPTQERPKTERHISTEVSDLLASTAETIKDPELQRALQKLSGKKTKISDC